MRPPPYSTRTYHLVPVPPPFRSSLCVHPRPVSAGLGQQDLVAAHRQGNILPARGGQRGLAAACLDPRRQIGGGEPSGYAMTIEDAGEHRLAFGTSPRIAGPHQHFRQSGVRPSENGDAALSLPPFPSSRSRQHRPPALIVLPDEAAVQHLLP